MVSRIPPHLGISNIVKFLIIQHKLALLASSLFHKYLSVRACVCVHQADEWISCGSRRLAPIITRCGCLSGQFDIIRTDGEGLRAGSSKLQLALVYSHPWQVTIICMCKYET